MAGGGVTKKYKKLMFNAPKWIWAKPALVDGVKKAGSLFHLLVLFEGHLEGFPYVSREPPMMGSRT